MSIYNGISFCGIFILLAIAWIFSEQKKRLNGKVIFWGLFLQFAVATFIFIFPSGAKVFSFFNEVIIKILNSATAGSQFVFGRLALSPGQVSVEGEKSLGFILAFQAFPTIIFFSALISVLYFFNIMQFFLKAFSSLFTKFMGISGVESLASASNIFVGIESILTIKPHLKDLTRSEICTILTVGMATVASNVLALYVFCLKDQFPSIAGHLISASLLSAPAALMFSKIIVPERESPKTLGTQIDPYYERESHVFEAIINGANAGLKMIVGIVALLIAVLGLVSLLDLLLSAFGNQINLFFGLEINWSLKTFMGWIFYPFTIILGVPLSEASRVSQIIGERLIVTEVVAYQDLALAIKNGMIQDPRSQIITVYALCGFAHLASMAIFVGGFTALVPKKTKEIAQVAPRALLAATFACLVTACVAGTFYCHQSILFG